MRTRDICFLDHSPRVNQTILASMVPSVVVIITVPSLASSAALAVIRRPKGARRGADWDGRRPGMHRRVAACTGRRFSSDFSSDPWWMLAGMASWSDVTTTAQALAERVAGAFAVRKHATMATVRRDGAPRISGAEVEFADDGEIYLAMMPGTRRAADLRRDARLAVHSPTVDPPTEGGAGWPGEAKLTGVAIEVSPDRFRIDLSTVVLTRLAADGAELEISIWQADSHTVQVVRRD